MQSQNSHPPAPHNKSHNSLGNHPVSLPSHLERVSLVGSSQLRQDVRQRSYLSNSSPRFLLIFSCFPDLSILHSYLHSAAKLCSSSHMFNIQCYLFIQRYEFDFSQIWLQKFSFIYLLWQWAILLSTPACTYQRIIYTESPSSESNEENMGFYLKLLKIL